MEKKRLTHDQSFDGLGSNTSINDRINKDMLEPLLYGFMFSRLLHMIHAMRMCHPHIIILLTKYDPDAAYCRMHMNAASAAKCICMTTVCALIYLRLTFGGSSRPAEWCVIIEIITDLQWTLQITPTGVTQKLLQKNQTRHDSPLPYYPHHKLHLNKRSPQTYIFIFHVMVMSIAT